LGKGYWLLVALAVVVLLLFAVALVKEKTCNGVSVGSSCDSSGNCYIDVKACGNYSLRDIEFSEKNSSVILTRVFRRSEREILVWVFVLPGSHLVYKLYADTPSGQLVYTCSFFFVKGDYYHALGGCSRG